MTTTADRPRAWLAVERGMVRVAVGASRVADARELLTLDGVVGHAYGPLFVHVHRSTTAEAVVRACDVRLAAGGFDVEVERAARQPDAYGPGDEATGLPLDRLPGDLTEAWAAWERAVTATEAAWQVSSAAWEVERATDVRSPRWRDVCAVSDDATAAWRRAQDVERAALARVQALADAAVGRLPAPPLLPREERPTRRPVVNPRGER